MNGMRDRFTKKKKDNYRKEKKRKEKKTRRATQFCFAYTKLGTCTGNDSSSRKCPLFSIKKKRRGHINFLEGESFLLLLRWILRKRANHCTRVVILCDSAVWVGGAAKGRSSTALNRLLRKAAMLGVRFAR